MAIEVANDQAVVESLKSYMHTLWEMGSKEVNGSSDHKTLRKRARRNAKAILVAVGVKPSDEILDELQGPNF